MNREMIERKADHGFALAAEIKYIPACSLSFNSILSNRTANAVRALHRAAKGMATAVPRIGDQKPTSTISVLRTTGMFSFSLSLIPLLFAS